MGRREEHARYVRTQRMNAVVRAFLLGIAALFGGILVDLHVGFLITGAVIVVLAGAGWLHLKRQQRQ